MDSVGKTSQMTGTCINLDLLSEAPCIEPLGPLLSNNKPQTARVQCCTVADKLFLCAQK